LQVSEGIDFADCHARAVVMVGIPYPPMLDPRVVMKRIYLDCRRKAVVKKTQVRANFARAGQMVQRVRVKALPRMTADDWYQLEATRAVSQAIGRVIRHRNDFGLVLLADQRFESWQVSGVGRRPTDVSISQSNRLPAWLTREPAVLAVHYTHFWADVDKFFARHRVYKYTTTTGACALTHRDLVQHRPHHHHRRSSPRRRHARKARAPTPTSK